LELYSLIKTSLHRNLTDGKARSTSDLTNKDGIKRPNKTIP